MNKTRKTIEAKKQDLIAGLVAGRGGILAAIQALPPGCEDVIFLGTWSLKDLVAHLVGWDSTNIQAVQEILAGQYPAFFQFYDKDWQGYNRRLVQQHRKDSLPELLLDAAASHRQLIAFLQSLGAADLLNAKASRPSGRSVTIRNLLRSEAADEQQHAEQIRRILNREDAKDAKVFLQRREEGKKE